MYDVSYSGRVIEMLQQMIARNRPQAARILAAVREIDHRLRVYPQFGQPLHDLSVEGAQLWIGTVDPLIVHYVVVEASVAGRNSRARPMGMNFRCRKLLTAYEGAWSPEWVAAEVAATVPNWERAMRRCRDAKRQ